ncbi:DNA-binding transcriptional regulator [Pseudomonas putida]|uniref:DNA-binding transcriptional regulator n=1 Tax=Pseudomonas putida TaxID=303 RepID=UPI001CE3D394|nr:MULTISPECIES: DNA-binding transcriptional regulator [Pseudomonas]MDZ5111386.1 DNA-binding transcriptional regulator [Pseudomonas putida]
MNKDRDTEYKTVRGLSRGLALLNALNRLDGGASSTRLAEITGLHRTTVRRLLETLQDEGYVRRSNSDDSFRLSLKVRELSEGFRDEQWISAVAAPLLGDLLQQVVWPTDISTLDVDAMVVRETTHRFSRLSFHRSMVGRRLPLLQTATGLAYLAFCEDAEREQILQLLGAREGAEYRLARDRLALDNILRKARHRGYGENYMGWNREANIASIAVPLHDHDNRRLLGCVGLIYIAKAMSIDQAAERYLPALKAFAQRVQQELKSVTSVPLGATGG